jgi:hypothetical protein
MTCGIIWQIFKYRYIFLVFVKFWHRKFFIIILIIYVLCFLISRNDWNGIYCAKLSEGAILQLDVLVKTWPIPAPAHPRVVEVPLPVDDGALGGPRALGHGDGGAEVLVGGLVRAADEAVGVEDLAHEVEGLEGDSLAAVVDLLREEGAQRAAAVEARLDLLPELRDVWRTWCI